MSSSLIDNLSPPSWEVLVLVSHHLDPKSLATASCVSKSWLSCFSSDHLWAPLCSAHFPSLSSLSTTTIPRRRLYALGHSAAQRRLQKPPRKPRLSLNNLLFNLSIAIPTPARRHVISVIKPCACLTRDPHGLFRFDLDVGPGEVEEREWTAEELKEVRVTWNVVEAAGEENGWRGVFTMAADCGGKGAFVSGGLDGWFSEELPPAIGCCGGGPTRSSGFVADLRLGLVAVGGDGGCNWDPKDCYVNNDGGYGVRSSRKVRIKKVSVGVLSILNWRYISVEDCLSYLDNFLSVS